MKILESIEEFKDPKNPLVLTIGNFDGVHRGHNALLKKVIELAGPEGQSVIITFSNHPSQILRPENPACLITTFAHRLQLLQEYRLDVAILIPFTRSIAQRNAASFIESLRQKIPFTHLVLGHDATLGRDKQGNPEMIRQLGDLWGFATFYIEEYRFEGKAVSSSRIREAIQQGNLHEAETLLNRQYSIYAPVIQEEGKSLLLDVPGLCLPPAGIYAVEVIINAKHIAGTATIEPFPNLTLEKAVIELRLNDNAQVSLSSGSFLAVNFIGPLA